MKKQTTKPVPAGKPRAKAKAKPEPHTSKAEEPSAAESDSLKLIQEMELQQIELERQNKELILAKHLEEIAREKYTNLFNFAPMGMAFVAPDGHWLKVNPVIPALLGYTEAELLAKTFQEITHPQDLAQDLDYVRQMLEGTIQSYQMEKRFFHKSGSIIWVLLSVSLVHDHEGNPLHFISQMQDITARKQAEEYTAKNLHYEILRRRITEQSLMVDNQADFNNFALHELGTTLKCSRAYVFEYDPATDTLNNTYEWCAPGIIPQIENLVGFKWADLAWWRTSLLENGLINYSDIEDIPDTDIRDILRPQGILSILVVPLYCKGELHGFLGFDDCSTKRIWQDEVAILLDISKIVNMNIELARSQKALMESETRLRTLYETMAQGVIYMNSSGEIIHANPAAERILGVSLAQLQSRTSLDPRWHAIHEDGTPFPGETHPAMVALATGKENSAVMGVFDPAQEKYKWINISAIPGFRPGDDKPYQVFTTFEDITELKNSFLELDKTRELLEIKVEERTQDLTKINNFQKAILDNAPIAIITTDLDGICRSINPAGEIMTGYSADKVIGKMTPLHFHDREELRQYYSKIHENPDPTEQQIFEVVNGAISDKTTEWHYVRKNGQKFPVKISHSSLIGSDGNVSGYIGLVLDVTREKEYLESLRESEAVNRAILNAVPDLMFRIHRDGTYLDSHSQNQSALYAPKELFIGKKVMEVLPPDQSRQAMQAIERAFATGQVEQYEYMLPGQDKDRYFENRIIAISDEQILSMVRDITDRKESETALKMQSAAFESFALPIIITDSEGRIQWVNSAYTKLTGYSAEEAMEKTPGELSKSGSQDEDFYKAFWDAIKGGKVWSGELQNRRKDGSQYPEEMTVTPVLDQQGRVSGFIAIKIDITVRKKMEQSLLETIEREKELGELKSKFISITSHEFRTPLATIRASSDSLATYWDNMTQAQRENRLVKINDQVLLMAGYIDEMLLLSRLQTPEKMGEPEQFDLVGLFREIVEELRALPGNSQRIDFMPMAERIIVNLFRLEVRAVVSNLVINSLKYSAQDKKVMVSLSASESDVEFMVKDRGIGIPEEELSRLYEPFFRASNTTNIPGSGLGLSIVKEAVERQNGKIAIESRLNRGTTVVVVLPVAIQ